MVADLGALTDDELLELKSELSDESERVKDDPDEDERVRLRIWAVDEELERRGFFGDGT
jgi:hypothetical protein